MYCDLYLPWPASAMAAAQSAPRKRDKGKGKAAPAPVLPEAERDAPPRSCSDGLAASERADMANAMGMAGHLGCTVVALTVTPPVPGQVPPSPFAARQPFAETDPRNEASTSAPGPGSTSPQRLVQLSRLHIPLDDSGAHGLTTNHTAHLNTYDLLSVLPTTSAAFSAACLSHTQPGPHQVALITLPLHHAPRMPFPLKRSLVKQALRHGAVFELCYAPALAPSSSSSSGADDEQLKRARQNWLTNAREVVRVTGGRGIVLSSGPGTGGGRDAWYGMRGPADLINLACLLGMKANLAKAAVVETPRKVILRAQARRYYKGVTGIPRMVMPPDAPAEEGAKRRAEDADVAGGADEAGGDWTNKKIRLDDA